MNDHAKKIAKKFTSLGAAILLIALALVLIFIALLTISNDAIRFLVIWIGVVLGASALIGQIYGFRLRQAQTARELRQAQELLAKVAHQTIKTPDIAGSVSKLRAQQQRESQKLQRVVEAIPAVNTSANVLASASVTPTPALASVNMSEDLNERETDFGKKWQLTHQLILPYQSDIDDYSLVIPKSQLLRQVKVAAIVDEFTYDSISPEVHLLPVTKSNWHEVFEIHQPDVFFCESAWRGYPTKEAPWKGSVYASKNFSYENRKALLEIIAYCRAQGIPTIFWNKEDPTHFGDKINDFVSTALQFDFIFTTARELEEEYRKLSSIASVHTMPFATQPRLFHPPLVRNEINQKDVVFAGSWYKIHTERNVIQGRIFDQLIDSGFGLAIYDRYSGKQTEYFGYPDAYMKYVHDAVPYRRTADLYRTHAFGLTINTVTDSHSMFARRIFEMISAGCTAISNHSVGIEELFPDEVVIAEEKDELSADALHNAREHRVEALNKVLDGHTYEKRLEDMFRAIGMNVNGASSACAIVVQVSDLAQISPVKKAVHSFGELAGQLVLLVAPEVPKHEILRYYDLGADGHTTVVSADYLVSQQGKIDNIFNFPTLWFADGVLALPTSEQLKRALNHFCYSKEPISVRPKPQMPMHSFRKIGAGCLMGTSQFRYHLLNGFDEELVLDV